MRSNVRKALAAGATPEEVQHVVLLSLTTGGFPATVVVWVGFRRSSGGTETPIDQWLRHQ
jgi:alkylhydroperoxidase/carboxymuconolactone decarboxylase family protein YurZ